MRHLIIMALLMMPVSAWGQQAPPSPLDVTMCEIADESGTGWVPDFVMVTHQLTGPHAGRIEVYDRVLQSLVRRPIKAVVTAETRQARTYGWALAGVTNHSGQFSSRLDFRLKIGKADGAAELTVTAEGYTNTMRGHGRCASAPR